MIIETTIKAKRKSGSIRKIVCRTIGKPSNLLRDKAYNQVIIDNNTVTVSSDKILTDTVYELVSVAHKEVFPKSSLWV